MLEGCLAGSACLGLQLAPASPCRFYEFFFVGFSACTHPCRHSPTLLALQRRERHPRRRLRPHVWLHRRQRHAGGGAGHGGQGAGHGVKPAGARWRWQARQLALMVLKAPAGLPPTPLPPPWSPSPPLASAISFADVTWQRLLLSCARGTAAWPALLACTAVRLTAIGAEGGCERPDWHDLTRQQWKQKEGNVSCASVALCWSKLTRTKGCGAGAGARRK